MDFDYFRRIQESDVTYTHTNECLEAIVEGLNLNNNSKVLAILGSGDQTFAMAEFASKIVAVDISKGQVEYASLRLETLKKGDFISFFNYSSEHYDRVKKYFDDDRLRRIQSRIVNGEVSIDFLEGDIFSEDFLNHLFQNYGLDFFNRIYLSNAIAHYFSNVLKGKSLFSDYDSFHTKILLNLKNKLLKAGLIYVSESVNPKGLNNAVGKISFYLRGKEKKFIPTVYIF